MPDKSVKQETCLGSGCLWRWAWITQSSWGPFPTSRVILAEDFICNTGFQWSAAVLVFKPGSHIVVCTGGPLWRSAVWCQRTAWWAFCQTCINILVDQCKLNTCLLSSSNVEVTFYPSLHKLPILFEEDGIVPGINSCYAALSASSSCNPSPQVLSKYT